MLDWDEANNLPDAATWLLETRKCYRGCQKGLKQTDWGVSPQEPKFHKIPNWRRLDHRRPTAVHTVQWWLWHQKRWPGLYPSNTPRRYNPMRPAEPSHHTQKISIVPLRITYADDPCIVLYLLPLLPPKSPPNSRERFGFSQKSYMMRKKFNKRQHYYPIGIELILCGNLLDIELCSEVPWVFWSAEVTRYKLLWVNFKIFTIQLLDPSYITF